NQKSAKAARARQLHLNDATENPATVAGMRQTMWPCLSWFAMQFDWRTILGPTLTILVALIAFFVDRHFVTAPNPAPLFVCIVALASSISGSASGLTSAGIAVIFSALFFLNHRAAPGYDGHDIARMVLLALTAAGTALITGMLRQKWIDAFA